MMKNRLVHVSEDIFQKYMSFSEKYPGVVPPGYMLQKLTIFDFVYPILMSHEHRDVLEVGCGTGVHSSLLSQFGRVTASELAVPGSFAGAERDVDRDRKAVFGALARDKIEFSYNDGKSLPFADSSFDVVFHNSVIEHVDDPVRFNAEVARVLRPNGVAIGITGTPLFCWFRLARQMLLLPPILLRSLFRELRSSARPPKVSDEFRRFIEEGTDAAEADIDVREFYSRLAHFLSSPEYNRGLIEKIAASRGVSIDAFLARVVRHFDESSFNRFVFKFSPPTHGQHYRGVFDEMSEWDVGKWVDRAEAAGLSTTEIVPFRYHHLFEPTINIDLNSRLYHRFAGLIHKANQLGVARPELASEFIMVSRKPAQRAAAA
jgi:SAM-dependent methyltransferase